MAKKPHKASVTKTLKQGGATQSVFHKSGRVKHSGRFSQGFQIEDLPNSELFVTDFRRIDTPKISPNYDEVVNRINEKVDRNLHFYHGILNDAGYQAEHHQKNNVRGIRVVNPIENGGES